MNSSRRVAFTDGPLAGRVIMVPASAGSYVAAEYDDAPPVPRVAEDGSWQWPVLEMRQVTYSFYQYGYSLPWSMSLTVFSHWHGQVPYSFFWIGCCHGRPGHHDVMAAMSLLGISPPVPGESSPLRVRALTAAELLAG